MTDVKKTLTIIQEIPLYTQTPANPLLCNIDDTDCHCGSSTVKSRHSTKLSLDWPSYPPII